MTAASATVTTPSRPLPPVDAALPALSLLDTEVLTETLRATLPPRHYLENARVRYLEYTPGLRLVMHVDALIDGARRDASIRAGNAADQGWMHDAHAAPWLESVVHWMPGDPDLPLLAATQPELRSVLARVGAVASTEDEVALLAYVPSRQAVLRIGGWVLKSYAKEADFSRSAAALALVGDGHDLPTPRFTGAVPDLRTTVQEAVDGVPGSWHSAIDLAPTAGRILRDLHRSGRRSSVVMDPRTQLAAVDEAVSLLGTVLPRQQHRAERLRCRLYATAPSGLPLVLSHGDFNIGQLLICADGVVATDVDMLCLAPAAYDLASYSANLVSGRPEDAIHAEAALTAIVATHGHVPGLRWHLATALLRRCDRPFRRAKKRWPERATSVLGLAEKVSESWSV